MTDFDQGPIIAIADLCQRSGAKRFEIGFLHDDVPAAEASWWASAGYKGSKLIIEDQESPQHACDGLACRLLDGGFCTYCGERTTTAPTRYGSYASPNAGPCVWRRDGERWVSGCRP